MRRSVHEETEILEKHQIKQEEDALKLKDEIVLLKKKLEGIYRGLSASLMDPNSNIPLEHINNAIGNLARGKNEEAFAAIDELATFQRFQQPRGYYPESLAYMKGIIQKMRSLISSIAECDRAMASAAASAATSSGQPSEQAEHARNVRDARSAAILCSVRSVLSAEDQLEQTYVSSVGL